MIIGKASIIRKPSKFPENTTGKPSVLERMLLLCINEVKLHYRHYYRALIGGKGG